MKKDVVYNKWNVCVRGYYDIGYKLAPKVVEENVEVFARNFKEAKMLAKEEAKRINLTFLYSKIKIRRKDVCKI